MTSVWSSVQDELDFNSRNYTYDRRLANHVECLKFSLWGHQLASKKTSPGEISFAAEASCNTFVVRYPVRQDS